MEETGCCGYPSDSYGCSCDKPEYGKCQRCAQEIVPKQHAIFWSGMFGAPFGVYCPLCWEISMSMWVMTQEDRQGSLEIVDMTITSVRKEMGYVLP